MKEEKINIGKLIEQYRYWVGGGLLVLVLLSSSYLVYARNRQEVDAKTKVSILEERIASLERNQVTEAAPSNKQDQEMVTPDQPKEATIQPKTETPSKPTPKIKGATTKPPVASSPINLNTATLAQLDSLSGIGPTYAQRIIDYRDSHGGFKTIEEVKNVKGIGEKTFEKFRDKITVE